jgi:hypothetical protein
METKHTPGPWSYKWEISRFVIDYEPGRALAVTAGFQPENAANARLIAAAPTMFECLEEGRRAIGDHNAPVDCYATGPLTGDPFRDLVQCPACSFISMYDAVKAKIEGAAIAKAEGR